MLASGLIWVWRSRSSIGVGIAESLNFWVDMALYHIATIAQWQAAQESGSYIADSLGIEGFIHCSTETQIRPVANAFFRGQTGLVLLELDRHRLLSEVRDEWVDAGGIFPAEMSRVFPHVYGPINLDAVVRVVGFEAGVDGGWDAIDDLQEGVSANEPEEGDRLAEG